MCPPPSVKMWPAPACLSVRSTRCPPLSSAMRLPEPLPLHALAVHAFLDEGVAHGVDRVAAAAHVDHEPVHAVNEPIHDGGRLTRLAAPNCLRFPHRRHIGKAWIAPRQRAELGVVEEPRGIP